ncbi:MAG: Ig-like domain-containing protein [Desulfuromonadaceae bacterium]|nr:Ig-like domain-containing protein [Desulfuromonadaceae bacterium]MDD5104468.1 Ig-like domain-containing protein [Desulfuromonadaceae bacterium]
MNTRLLRLLLFLSFILVTGCSGTDPSGLNSPSNITGNAAVFNIDLDNPAASEVPLPNVLVTALSKDPLTGIDPLKGLTGSEVARSANSSMTPLDALAYVNNYEVGGSGAVSGVNAPIYIRFSSPVDPASVTSTSIKVFQTAGDPSPSPYENNTLTFSDVSGMFKYQYTPGGTDLFLFPNFPLSPATRYLYVVTNKVLDAATGKPICSTKYFDILKSKFPLVGSVAKLEIARGNIMSGSNIAMSGYAKVMDDLITQKAATKIESRDDIALMGRFITTVAGFVPKVATGPGGTVVLPDLVTSNMVPVESALRAFAAGTTVTGQPSAKTWANSIGTPTTVTAADFWTEAGSTTAVPTTVSKVIKGTINSAQLSIDPVVKKANAASMDLTGISLGGMPAYNPAAGVTQSFRDGTGALTGYYHTTTTVPFVYIVPTGAAPTGGWPLVIFQHGINSKKERVTEVAGKLTEAGYAVVAIDLPLHGALAAINPATGIAHSQAYWGMDFMAIGAPLAGRSNVQQAAFNLNRLDITLAYGGFAGLAEDAPNRTTVKPKYVGISLGSIVGAYYLAGNTGNGATPAATDMKGFLSVPGGRLAYLLQNSPTYGPPIVAGLAASAGIVKDSPTYHNFFQVTQSVIDPVDPATMTSPVQSGLPSRLSGRLVIQEAVGDSSIPNDNTRYFGNALGGRGILNTTAALAVAPGFSQLKYLDGTLPAPFMLTRTGGVVDGAPTSKTDFARAQGTAGTSPSEGYFQFNQASIAHSFLVDNSPAANTLLAQTQMVAFLLKGVVIDPTTAGPLAKSLNNAPSLEQEILLPPIVKILGY